MADESRTEENSGSQETNGNGHGTGSITDIETAMEKPASSSDVNLYEVKKSDEIKSMELTPAQQEIKQFEVIAEQVLASKLAPRGVDTIEKVMVILHTGRELGFTPMMSLNNIHVIEGKPALGVHMVAALLKRNGIDYKTVSDYEPIYKEVKQADGTVKDGLVDFKTVIRFYRKGITGILLEEDVTFTFKDAQAAGLVNKNNWKSYPKLMMWNRCLVIGARRIAPDALLGMYETSELGDAFNVSYQIEEVQ